MFRALAPYMFVSVAVALVTGWLYADGVIGVPATYGLTTLATMVTVAGYLRWDKQHYG